jgi:hypothetical protein
MTIEIVLNRLPLRIAAESDQEIVKPINIDINGSNLTADAPMKRPGSTRYPLLNRAGFMIAARQDVGQPDDGSPAGGEIAPVGAGRNVPVEDMWNAHTPHMGDEERNVIALFGCEHQHFWTLMSMKHGRQPVSQDRISGCSLASLCDNINAG